MKKLKTIRITQSQSEVLKSVMGIERLKYRGNTGILRYKRHDKAIEQLKELGVLVLGEGNILSVVNRSNASRILIENKF